MYLLPDFQTNAYFSRVFKSKLIFLQAFSATLSIPCFLLTWPWLPCFNRLYLLGILFCVFFVIHWYLKYLILKKMPNFEIQCLFHKKLCVFPQIRTLSGALITLRVFPQSVFFMSRFWLKNLNSADDESETYRFVVDVKVQILKVHKLYCFIMHYLLVVISVFMIFRENHNKCMLAECHLLCFPILVDYHNKFRGWLVQDLTECCMSTNSFEFYHFFSVYFAHGFIMTYLGNWFFAWKIFKKILLNYSVIWQLKVLWYNNTTCMCKTFHKMKFKDILPVLKWNREFFGFEQNYN